MNFLTKKVPVIWAIILPILTFLLGPGFIWEWRKTDVEIGRLDIDRARASYEMRQKMSPLLLEILKLEINSPERLSKEDDFNAAETNLARIEGRKPVLYRFRPPDGDPTGLTIK